MTLFKGDKARLRQMGNELIEMYSRCIDDLLLCATSDTYDVRLGKIIETRGVVIKAR